MELKLLNYKITTTNVATICHASSAAQLGSVQRTTSLLICAKPFDSFHCMEAKFCLSHKAVVLAIFPKCVSTEGKQIDQRLGTKRPQPSTNRSNLGTKQRRTKRVWVRNDWIPANKMNCSILNFQRLLRNQG